MKMTRTVILVVAATVFGGCISYPNTKALVTPIGAVGFHTFAPAERTPDTMRAAELKSERLARAFETDEARTAN